MQNTFYAQLSLCLIDKHLEFVGVDEIQMCADHERGHIFTDRLLNIRGEKLTMLMGSKYYQKYNIKTRW